MAIKKNRRNILEAEERGLRGRERNKEDDREKKG